MAQLSQSIDLVYRQVVRDCQERADYGLVTSISGVGANLAKIILLETGPVERYPAIGNYVSYARYTPTARISKNKQKGQGHPGYSP
ncbi:MAG: transposase [Pseudomonadota bacterium]